MSKSYKVWIVVEEYDEETGDGHDIDSLSFSSTAEFDNEEEAEAFALSLHSYGGGIHAA